MPDGRRMVREIFLLVPKKNNKTTGGAAVMMTALLANDRPRAEYLFVGPLQGTADLAFGAAVGMIDADDAKQRERDGTEGRLKQLLRVQTHLKTIINRRNGAKLRIKTFSEQMLTGPRPSGVMVDELHMLGKDPAAARVIGQLRGGMIHDAGAFLLICTTQSDEPPAGVFLSELTMARMIRDGGVDGSMLPVLYELPTDLVKSEAWRDPALWPMVNPNMGRSVHRDTLADLWERAKIDGEKEIRRFASQHINVQIGVALQSNAWDGAPYWERNAEPELTLAAILARCEVVTIGIDGGGLDDLLALTVIGRVKGTAGAIADDITESPAPTTTEDGAETESAADAPPAAGQWLHWAHAWCYKDVLQLRQDIAPRLQDFAAAGDLTIVERVGDDVIALADIVEQVFRSGLLPDKNAIGVDPAGIGEIVEELARRGIDSTPEAGIIIGIPQGWKLNGAIKTTGRKLAGGDLKHCGQPLMAWCVGNAKVEPRGNAISITKQVSGTAKIDPLMATFNASALMALNPGPVEVDARIIILESA
jgi:phage terminase large subunit-like protein